MKVLIVTSIHARHDKRIWRHAVSLREHGLLAGLVCPWGKGPAEDEGVRLYSFTPRSNRFYRILCNPLMAVWLTFRHLGECDIVHFHDFDLLPLMSIVSLFRPTIYDMHENYPEEMLKKSWLPPVFRRPLRLLAHHGQRLFSNIIRNVVIVAPSQKRCLSPTSTRSVEVRNYPPLKFIAATKDDYKDREPLVVFTGTLYTENGSDMVLDIARGMKSRGIGIRMACFDMVDKKDEQAFREKYARYDIADILTVLPRVEYRGMIGALNRATIGLIPNRACDTQEKAIPTKLFEYMASALPIVCSDLPFQKAVVVDSRCGVVVNDGDVGAYIDAIVDLAGDRNRAQRLGRNGQDAVKAGLNWEGEMDKLFGFYLTVV